MTATETLAGPPDGEWPPLPEWVSPQEWEARIAASREPALEVGSEAAWQAAVVNLLLRDGAGASWCYNGSGWLVFDGQAWAPGTPAGPLTFTPSPFAPPVPIEPDPGPPAEAAAPEVGEDAIDPDVIADVVALQVLLDSIVPLPVEIFDCPGCGAALAADIDACPACDQRFVPFEASPEESEDAELLAAIAMAADPVAGPDSDPVLDRASGPSREPLEDYTSPPAPCASCGTSVPGDSAFCRECGHIVGEEVPAPPSEAVESAGEVQAIPGAEIAPGRILCPACGAAAAVGGRFCGTCGAVVAVAPPPADVCASCQAELAPAAKFCGRCGAPSGSPPQ